MVVGRRPWSSVVVPIQRESIVQGMYSNVRVVAKPTAAEPGHKEDPSTLCHGGKLTSTKYHLSGGYAEQF